MDALVTPRRFVLTVEHMESNTGHSLTVPDESMTIREILARHTRGIAPPIAREMGFDSGADFDSADLEKMRHLDPFEREEFATWLKERQALLKADVEARRREDHEVREELRKKKEQDSKPVDPTEPEEPKVKAKAKPTNEAQRK